MEDEAQPRILFENRVDVPIGVSNDRYPSPTSTDSPSSVPTIINPTSSNHGMAWFTDDEQLLRPIRTSPFRKWSLRTPVGETLQDGSNLDQRMSRMDFFLLLFPPEQLKLTVNLTNDKLRQKGKK